MPTLKAKIGGNWVTLLSPGAAPVGGAVGDLLTKSGAPDYAMGWSTTIPKLSLNSTTPADLTSVAHPLTLGTVSATNIALGNARIQARNNGVASTLNLNPFGGAVAVGAALTVAGGATITAPTGSDQTLTLNTGYTTGNEGAQLNFNGAPGKAAFSIDNYNGDFRLLQGGAPGGVGLAVTAAGQVQIQGTQSLYFSSYGGGWFMQDTTWIRSVGNKAIYTSNEHRGTVFRFEGTGYKFTHDTDTDTGIYYDSDGAWRLMANGASTVQIASNWLTINTSCTVGGTLYAANIGDSGTSPAEIYVGNWFRCRGTGGIYWQQGAGLTSPAGGWVQTYSSHFALGDYVLRLRQYTDGNHQISYSGAGASTIHPASGVGSNGPWIQGYSTVVLGIVSSGWNTLWSNNWFVDTSQGYQKFSSALIKDEIEPIDPAEALEQVNRWRPVTYLRKGMDDGLRYDGFIAEELHKVNPRLVVCVKEEDLNETPEQIEARNADPDLPSVGQPNALDYGALTVRLTGAVQALTARIEELERKVA